MSDDCRSAAVDISGQLNNAIPFWVGKERLRRINSDEPTKVRNDVQISITGYNVAEEAKPEIMMAF